MWKAIWSSLNDRNFFELDHALGRHNSFLDGELAQTFVGNHDVTRLATQLTDDRHFGHAVAVLMCIGGVPSVYYGDEQGFRGLKENREGGDDEIRPAFPAVPGRARPRRLALLPPAPAPDRLPPPPPLAGPRADRRRAPDRLRDGPARIRAPSPARACCCCSTSATTRLSSRSTPTGLTVAEVPDPGDVPADPLTVPPHSWTILA